MSILQELRIVTIDGQKNLTCILNHLMARHVAFNVVVEILNALSYAECCDLSSGARLVGYISVLPSHDTTNLYRNQWKGDE
jgi:hypothetical protein